MDGLVGPETVQGELGCDSAILFATCVVLRRRAKKRKAVALLASMDHPGERERNTTHARVPRTPMVWSERMRLSDGAFRRRYRMPKGTFTSLCDTLAGPMADMHGLLGHRIPHGVSVEVQVSVSIRWLAGGSYLDIVDVHGVSTTTLYQSLHAFLFALVHHPRYKIEFPIEDEGELDKIAEGFAEIDRTGCFTGCVGALDGLIVPIQKPSLHDCANPANYRNRKGMFAVIAQVCARARGSHVHGRRLLPCPM